jgi:hypothetical protein
MLYVKENDTTDKNNLIWYSHQDKLYTIFNEWVKYTNLTVRNDNDIFHIEWTFPLYDIKNNYSLTLDPFFKDLLPSHIEWLYIKSESNENISILSDELIHYLNVFLQWKSSTIDNLYSWDCLDFVYAMCPWNWINNSNWELEEPIKERFIPYEKHKEKLWLPIMYYKNKKRQHASLCLWWGLCLSRMWEWWDLMVNRIEDLKVIYWENIFIGKDITPSTQ